MELDDSNPLVELCRDDQDPTIHHLDVRPLLEDGGEPYSVIMSCVGQLETGQTLIVHALFEPKPLMRQVERMGLVSESEHVGPDHWALRIREA